MNIEVILYGQVILLYITLPDFERKLVIGGN